MVIEKKGCREYHKGGMTTSTFANDYMTGEVTYKYYNDMI